MENLIINTMIEICSFYLKDNSLNTNTRSPDGLRSIFDLASLGMSLGQAGREQKLQTWRAEGGKVVHLLTRSQ